MTRLLLLAGLLLSTGCGFGHRHLRLLAPDQVAYTASDVPPPVTFEVVDKHGDARPLAHELMEDRDGRTLLRPGVLRQRDTLVITPTTEDSRVRLWIRGTGWLDRSLVPVRTITGTLDRRFANELLFLPVDTPLEEPLVLPIAVLAGPYNPYRLDNGDLLVIEASGPDGVSRRTLLERRDRGLRGGFFAGLLITIPTGGGNIAPVLSLGPALKWQTPKAAGPARALEAVELVMSVGIGSTTLAQAIDPEGLEPEVSGAFNAALVGGGVRLVRVLTIQGFVNASRFFRKFEEAPGTLAVGIDATGLAALTRDAFSRLIREHPVPNEARSMK